MIEVKFEKFYCSFSIPELDAPMVDIECILNGIDTSSNGPFALGDKVYYIQPFNMFRIKRGTIKQIISKYEVCGNEIVLDNGDVVHDSDLFLTLDDARAYVIEDLKSHIVNGHNNLVGLQRKIAIYERLLATLESYEKKKRNHNP